MKSMYVAGGLVIVGASLGLAATGVRAQSHEDPGARSLFIRYCADCHGPSGRGDGPAAAGLRPPPADLTRSTLSRSDLIRVIDGRRPVKGHGAPSMPAWGSIFSNQAGASGQRASEIRVEALADEVLLLRQRSSKPEAP
jgi:mono/diheme cytochrome c family protein